MLAVEHKKEGKGATRRGTAWTFHAGRGRKKNDGCGKNGVFPRCGSRVRYQNDTAPDVMLSFATLRAVQEQLSEYVVLAGKLRRRCDVISLGMVVVFIYLNKTCRVAGLLSRR